MNMLGELQSDRINYAVKERTNAISNLMQISFYRRRFKVSQGPAPLIFIINRTTYNCIYKVTHPDQPEFL